MYGKARRNHSYYVCRPDMRHHNQRRAWYETHPKTLWVREDDLLGLTNQFFAEHVLGPRREAEGVRTGGMYWTVRPAP